jgi:hypothetical protein
MFITTYKITYLTTQETAVRFLAALNPSNLTTSSLFIDLVNHLIYFISYLVSSLVG